MILKEQLFQERRLQLIENLLVGGTCLVKNREIANVCTNGIHSWNCNRLVLEVVTAE